MVGDLARKERAEEQEQRRPLEPLKRNMKTQPELNPCSNTESSGFFLHNFYVNVKFLMKYWEYVILTSNTYGKHKIR